MACRFVGQFRMSWCRFWMQVLSWKSFLMKKLGALRAHALRFALHLMTIINTWIEPDHNNFRKTEIHLRTFVGPCINTGSFNLICSIMRAAVIHFSKLCTERIARSQYRYRRWWFSIHLQRKNILKRSGAGTGGGGHGGACPLWKNSENFKMIQKGV